MRIQNIQVLLGAPILAVALWIATLWLTTGRGHPFCLSTMNFPTHEILVREGVKRHLERRILSVNVIDPRTGKPSDPDPGPFGELPARAETAEAFLREFPQCCSLEPLGSIQNDLDKTVNLLINHEEIYIRVKDPTWREPYISIGDDYLVDTCSLHEEK